jgi:protein tyrosine phosphatase (PTP) superfamily phosphohydrolase (DUF442 family)
MSDYQITWITENIAVGSAPMSYDDLDAIREQGVDAIVNLCGEFCDLYEIEEKTGFEVYYLPIPDECAPDMEDMEKALAWLDEAIYLGKKILVHCRFGIGRTGTFVTAYLIRKGLGLKVASKKMKKSRANPSAYSQWRLVKKYSKKSGVLKIREPSLESRNVVDLSTYFSEYEALVRKTTSDINTVRKTSSGFLSCGEQTDDCCRRYFEVQLIEAIYLNNRMNRFLKSELRTRVIHDAVEITRRTTKVQRRLMEKGPGGKENKEAWAEAYARQALRCPLNHDHRCSLTGYRPISCRIHGLPEGAINNGFIISMLQELSRNVFFSFSGFFLDGEELSFSLADTVSGKFVQKYFYYLANLQS